MYQRPVLSGPLFGSDLTRRPIPVLLAALRRARQYGAVPYLDDSIHAILRHKNPNTTDRYLKRLGLEDIREALEEGRKGPVEVIQFKEAVGEN